MNNESVEKKDEQALETKCPACKASISFNPTLGKWKCEYCGSEFTLEEMQKKSDNSSTIENNNTKVNSTVPPKDEYSKYISYRCESCGAEIIADEQTAATFCIYCGNTAILKSKLSGEFSPSKIIPFKKTRDDAVLAFKNLSKGRPLMPKSFNNESNIEKIKGVYVPFWLYDFNVSGDVIMKNKIVKTWTTGRTHYTKTSVYDVIRGGSMDFNNIPADASSRFDDDIMNSIEPFDFNELIPYNHAYLSGFYAEKYDVPLDKMASSATSRALYTARETLSNHMTAQYTTKNIVSNTLAAKQNTVNYVLLPVWMVNVKYKDEMYIFAMNGQTGEFIGNIPLDKGKTIIYFISVFALCMLLLFVISYIIYVVGG